MNERVRQEVELLKAQFPDLKHGDKFDWVLIPNLALPAGRFTRTSVSVLFAIPVGYPQTGPDNFFTEADLRLIGDAMAPAFNLGSQSSSGPAPIQGTWGWFSWHPQSWTPTAIIEDGDNLMGFVRSINLCLRGEESA